MLASVESNPLARAFNIYDMYRYPGGGGHPLIRPKRVCAAQQGMVFRVLHLKQGIEFHYLAP